MKCRSAVLPTMVEGLLNQIQGSNHSRHGFVAMFLSLLTVGLPSNAYSVCFDFDD